MKAKFDFSVLVLSFAVAAFAHAQEQQQSVVAQSASAEAQPAVQAEAGQQQAQNAVTETNVQTQNGPVVIQTVPSLVKQQPITYVEASPLGESKVDQLRKARQDYEIQTEQRIVEKLEQSRLEDERSRAQRLFGGSLNSQPVQAVPTYQAVPQQAVQAVVPVEAPASSKQVEEAKNEIINKVEAVSAKSVIDAEELKKEQERNRKKVYASAILGAADYPDAENIDGQWAGGVAVGYMSTPNLSFEGGFLYSNYFIDQIWNYGASPAIFKELDQYNVSATLKYSFLTGNIKPFVGTSVSYTYRKYTDVMYHVPGAYQIPPDNSASTYAFDWGFLTGLSVKLTDTFYVGGEFRYNTNLTYRSNSALVGQRIYYNYGRPVEDFDYTSLTFSGTFLF